MILDKDFARSFHPASIAIVGVSDPNAQRGDKKVHSGGLTGGLPALRNLLKQGYAGRIYPVNPRATEILGYKVYPSVKEIPDKVDLVIVTVPAARVPEVLHDCMEAKMLNVHVMTSGFGETQEEEGIKLQDEIREIAMQGGLRMIGPNCMGLQVPSAKMSTFDVKSQYDGTASFVSQSGTLIAELLMRAEESRLGFNKLISCGNSLIIDVTDFVEYLASDDDTKIISMYIEGVRDGRRLLDIVKKINPVKPVIVWKVGLGESSARAALSHSGMLGGGRQIWDTFFRQTGAVRVNSMDDFYDTLMTFTYMKPPRGKNAAVFTAGGGATVAAGETCDRNGINAPALAPQTRDEMLKVVSLVNQGVANPLDLADAIFMPDVFARLLDAVSADPNIDFILLNWSLHGINPPERAARFADIVCDHMKNRGDKKPVALSFHLPTGRMPRAASDPWLQRIMETGVPVYDTLERACHALSSFIDYHNRFSKR